MLLATDVWVGALIRRAQLGGAFATVARHGDPRAGAVLVKIYDSANRTARLYSEATGPDGDRLWMRPLDTEVDAYIERQAHFDSDLWVVEIEDREGRHFLTEKVT